MPRKPTKNAQGAAPAPEHPLCEHMRKAYTMRPKASKYTGPRPPFNIAEQHAGDTWEWRISLGVLETDPPVLVLALYSIAVNPELISFVQGLGGSANLKLEHADLLVTLPSTDTATLRQLAGKIRAVPSEKWPWLSGKVADALDRLARHLDQYRPPA